MTDISHVAFRAFQTPVVSSSCDFGAYSAASDGYSTFSRPGTLESSDLEETYVQCQLWFPSLTVTNWLANASAPGPVLGTSPSGGEPGIALVYNNSTTMRWEFHNDFGSSGSTSNELLVAAALVPERCYTIGLHLTADSVQAKIDDVVYDVTTAYPPINWNPFYVYFGHWDSSEEDNSSDYRIYFDNIKIGTTGWGSTDVFSEDFEGGNLTDNDWSTGFGYGSHVSVVAAPF